MDIKVRQKLDKFFSQYRYNKYIKGGILIRAEEEPAGLIFLKKGVVRQYAVTANGDEVTINIFKPVSFFPLGWVVNDTVSPHYFEAMTDVSVYIAPKKEVLEFIRQEPDLMFDLLKRVYRGLEGYFVRIEQLMFGNAKTKLINEIIIYARRFGKQRSDGIRINLKITEKDLAVQSGLARETVSRVVTQLQDKDLINFKKNILIVKDLNRLEEELKF